MGSTTGTGGGLGHSDMEEDCLKRKTLKFNLLTNSFPTLPQQEILILLSPQRLRITEVSAIRIHASQQTLTSVSSCYLVSHTTYLLSRRQVVGSLDARCTIGSWAAFTPDRTYLIAPSGKFFYNTTQTWHTAHTSHVGQLMAGWRWSFVEK